MAKTRKTSKDISKSKGSPFKDYWNKNNYIILYIGIGLLILGFFLMSKGPWDNPLSLTVSPLILLIAYIIIIPFSIIFKSFKKKSKKTDVSS